MTWLAADYDWRLIVAWMTERKWPIPCRATATYYRKKYGDEIQELRRARRDGAINTGLALKEERVARLSEHADALDKIKWVPDDKGRLWNEAAWRETLADIAAEMGQRTKSVDMMSGGKPIGQPDTQLLAEIAQLLDTARARATDSSGTGGAVQVDAEGATKPASA